MLLEQKIFGVIYKITNLINDKVYIGLTTNLQMRKTTHRRFSKTEKPRQYIHRAIRRYGWENFAVDVVFCAFDRETLNEMEKFFIKEYKSNVREFGYNRTDGGEGTKGMRGHRHTEEVKIKMSLARKGKPLSEEHKLNMSLSKKGKINSKEHNSNIGLAHKNRVHSEKSRQNMSAARIKRPVVQLSMSGEIVAYHASSNAAQRTTGVPCGNISKCCNKKRNHAGGFLWRYATPPQTQFSPSINIL